MHVHLYYSIATVKADLELMKEAVTVTNLKAEIISTQSTTGTSSTLNFTITKDNLSICMSCTVTRELRGVDLSGGITVVVYSSHYQQFSLFLSCAVSPLAKRRRLESDESANYLSHDDERQGS